MGTVKVKAASEVFSEQRAAKKAQVISAVQAHLDSVAQEKGYDNILSLCTYATSSSPKFAAEGQAGVAWRDEVWQLCYEILAEVETGLVQEPTAEQVIAKLPEFVWPTTN